MCEVKHHEEAIMQDVDEKHKQTNKMVQEYNADRSIKVTTSGYSTESCETRYKQYLYLYF